VKEALARIDEHIARLGPSRPGIADFAMREHRRLGERLEAAQALADDMRRELAVRALGAQCVALVNELSRLSAPAPHSREYANG
jgi:hypothetical protein